jgi:glycosyltransferase involved in cell wall biosynthesis
MKYYGPLATVQAPISKQFKNSNSKKLQIAYMPRKREFETGFVKGLFKSLYPEFQSIPWIPIHNMSLADCARSLDESAVFASFSYIEGLGLPPLEAMASGCVVVGFNGLGGSDYSSSRNGFWVAEGDHFSFAHALAEAIRAATDPVWYAKIMSDSILTANNYSDVRFRSDLKSFWEFYLGDNKNEYILGSN